MKYLNKYKSFESESNLRKFNESSIYDKSWETLLPEELTLIKDGEHVFKKGNIMLNADMLQITYSNNEVGYPNTLEFDIYLSNNGSLKLDIDITYGDLVTSEFSIEAPNKVTVGQYTSYHSKFDPSNTVFALSDESLSGFVNFLNRFEGMKLSVSDFKFLDKNDNYNPN